MVMPVWVSQSPIWVGPNSLRVTVWPMRFWKWRAMGSGSGIRSIRVSEPPGCRTRAISVRAAVLSSK
ncbi:Uncharacterised protein [Mycobacterium tuberculosis]|nr:Uncharacterised protein [Mycobacterium tuberculosis]